MAENRYGMRRTLDLDVKGTLKEEGGVTCTRCW